MKQGPLGLHRFVEALKHTFALRMNLGDPDFVDISKTTSEILSPTFAKKVRERIFDNTTFPSEYYVSGWSQIQDHGTSNFCIVDADRNAVSIIQVFLNHFILGMQPLDAVQSPRVYHKLVPNVVYYENWTVIDGDHIELADDLKQFLRDRGHVLEPKSGGAVSQLIVQTLKKPIENRKMTYNHKQVLKGMLTAVSDPRKDGRPAAC